MKLRKDLSAYNGTLISTMDPPLLLCIHRGVANPLILKPEIHPCRYRLKCWISKRYR